MTKQLVLTEIVFTVACRPCHSGWYGQEDDRCPKCGGKVVVTDVFGAYDLAARP